MMKIAALIVAAATPTSGTVERSAWYDCLDSYAQVEMLSGRTAVNVALRARSACLNERKAFQVKVLRVATVSKADDDGKIASETLDEEDRAAAKHVIAFINRNR